MTYDVIAARIDARDDYEIVAVVTLRRRADALEGEVWVAAGIPEELHGTVDTLTGNGKTGHVRAYPRMADVWPVGDSLDCWCPPAFQADQDAALAAVRAAALTLWREAPASEVSA
jgi:hypothetical protein